MVEVNDQNIELIVGGQIKAKNTILIKGAYDLKEYLIVINFKNYKFIHNFK